MSAKQPGQEVCKLLPLLILPTTAHLMGQMLKPTEAVDLGPELADRSCCSGAIQNQVLRCYNLIVWCVLEVVEVVGAQYRRGSIEHVNGP